MSSRVSQEKKKNFTITPSHPQPHCLRYIAQKLPCATSFTQTSLSVSLSMPGHLMFSRCERFAEAQMCLDYWIFNETNKNIQMMSTNEINYVFRWTEIRLCEASSMLREFFSSFLGKKRCKEEKNSRREKKSMKLKLEARFILVKPHERIPSSYSLQSYSSCQKASKTLKSRRSPEWWKRN